MTLKRLRNSDLKNYLEPRVVLGISKLKTIVDKLIFGDLCIYFFYNLLNITL